MGECFICSVQISFLYKGTVSNSPRKVFYLICGTISKLCLREVKVKKKLPLGEANCFSFQERVLVNSCLLQTEVVNYQSLCFFLFSEESKSSYPSS